MGAERGGLEELGSPGQRLGALCDFERESLHVAIPERLLVLKVAQLVLEQGDARYVQAIHDVAVSEAGVGCGQQIKANRMDKANRKPRAARGPVGGPPVLRGGCRRSMCGRADEQGSGHLSASNV